MKDRSLSSLSPTVRLWNEMSERWRQVFMDAGFPLVGRSASMAGTGAILKGLERRGFITRTRIVARGKLYWSDWSYTELGRRLVDHGNQLERAKAERAAIAFASSSWSDDPDPPLVVKSRIPDEDLCVVCLERERVGHVFCKPCGRSHDNEIAKSNTHADAIAWAANRARRFERKRKTC